MKPELKRISKFYLSENGVWLTDAVPPEYLRFPGSEIADEPTE